MPHFYELLRDGSCVLTFSEHDEASQAFARYSRIHPAHCWELIEMRKASLAKYNPPKSGLPSTMQSEKPTLDNGVVRWQIDDSTLEISGPPDTVEAIYEQCLNGKAYIKLTRPKFDAKLEPTRDC